MGRVSWRCCSPCVLRSSCRRRSWVSGGLGAPGGLCCGPQGSLPRGGRSPPGGGWTEVRGCISDRAPILFPSPHKRARQLGACSPGCLRGVPARPLSSQTSQPFPAGARGLAPGARPALPRQLLVSACKRGCFCEAAPEPTANRAPVASRVPGGDRSWNLATQVPQGYLSESTAAQAAFPR